MTSTNVETQHQQLLEELGQLRQRISDIESALGIAPVDPLANALIALSSNCIYVAQRGLIRLASPGLQELVQYTHAQLEGMDVAALVHPDEADAVRKMFIDRPQEHPLTPGPFRIVTQPGDIRWVVGTVIPIRFRGEQASLGLLVDITEFMERLDRQR